MHLYNTGTGKFYQIRNWALDFKNSASPLLMASQKVFDKLNERNTVLIELTETPSFDAKYNLVEGGTWVFKQGDTSIHDRLMILPSKDTYIKIVNTND